MSRYQVQYQDLGQRLPSMGTLTRFGIVRKARSGHVLIDDAVLPFCIEVPDDDKVIDVPVASVKDFPRYDNNGLLVKGGTPYDVFVNKAFAEAQAKDKAAGKGVKVGRLFTLCVGDGHAYYVVTKVGKTKVTVEWRGFQADRYVDQMLGFGKAISMADAKRLIGGKDSEAAFWKSVEDKNADFLAAQPVGGFVYYQVNRGEWCCYLVVSRGGKKMFKPVGLVGDWQARDLPFRYPGGKEGMRSYWVTRVDEGEPVETLHANQCWGSEQFERTRGEGKFAWTASDPTNLPLLDLTLPPMTSEQAETARLANLANEVAAVLTGKEDKNDPYIQATHRRRLEEALRLLKEEMGQ